jgi:hypothetical protein
MEINPDTLEIEIVDIEPIEGGVQVFARAWSDGVQIGFGKDGTVDIERFRIFNPPILVLDENGDIIQVTPANETLDKPEFIQRFREDPTEALFQSLSHTLSVVSNVHGSSDIVPDKRGNTTSTFYPDADSETSSVDGGVITNITNPGESWSTIQGRATGTGVTESAANGYDVYIIHATTSNQFRYLGRAFFLFNSSAIPDGDSISSATVSIYSSAIDNSPAQTYALVASNPASNTAITTGDFDAFSSTLLAPEIAGSAITINQYTHFALNSDGLNNISKTGISKFGLRLKSDNDNTAPTWVSGNAAGWLTHYADTAGTTQDPSLVVEHAAGAYGYANTVLGVAPANIGKIMGIATANIAKVNGV